MKNTVLALTFSFLSVSGFAQNLYYEIHGNYERPIKKEALNGANMLHDFISGYPVNWINDYVSTEISATCNGKVVTASGIDETITAEQKNILNTAELGSNINVKVIYKNKNAVTGVVSDNVMSVSMMIVPEVEAEYIGGKVEMNKYLNENAIEKMLKTTPKEFQQGVVIFTVNAEGEIADAKISKTSGDSKTDKLLLKTINRMPKWKPAEDLNGIKLKQEFTFSVGNGGC